MSVLRRAVVFTFSFFLSAGNFFPQENKDGLVKWLSFKEAQNLNRTVPKPLIVDFYTDWCGWCKHMIKTTYSNPNLAAYINANFYPVKFDAETKDTIEYNGKIYKPLSKEPRTPHELTLKFLGDKLSYPSTMFITNNYEYNLLTQGYLDDKQIEPLLVFMVENAWRTSIFDEFSKHFKRSFYDTTFKKFPVKYTPVNELEKLQKKKPKKVLVHITADFCNTCRVMEKTTFTDSLIAAYVSKNYYLVNFNAERKDTIIFKNQKYFNTLINNYPMHNLAFQLAANRFTLPALCVLDEQLNTLDVLSFYQSPEQIKPMLEYFALNAYKSQSWQEFIKDYSNRTTTKQQKK